MRNLLALSLVLFAASGCSSDSSGGASPGGVGCRQKDDADGNKDCVSFAGKPRQLDCDVQSQVDEAVAAGCVLQKPGSTDVCCPTSVSGQREVSLGCSEPADALTDSECAGTPQGRKLDCDTAQLQQQGIGLGCRAESPGSTTDFDLCCRANVRGAVNR